MALIDEILLRDIKHKKDFVNVDGDLELISGLENIKEWIFRTIITTPGSLIHRPDYGVGIKEFHNAPMTLETQRTIARRIEDNLIRDERIEAVKGVRFDPNDEQPELTKMFIRIKVKGFDEAQMEFIPFGAGV